MTSIQDNKITIIDNILKDIWKVKITQKLADSIIDIPKIKILLYFPYLNSRLEPEYYAVIKEVNNYIYLIATVNSGIKDKTKTQIYIINKKFIEIETINVKKYYFANPIRFDETYKSPIIPIECPGDKDKPEKYFLQSFIVEDVQLREILLKIT